MEQAAMLKLQFRHGLYSLASQQDGSVSTVLCRRSPKKGIEFFELSHPESSFGKGSTQAAVGCAAQGAACPVHQAVNHSPELLCVPLPLARRAARAGAPGRARGLLLQELVVIDHAVSRGVDLAHQLLDLSALEGLPKDGAELFGGDEAAAVLVEALEGPAQDILVHLHSAQQRCGKELRVLDLLAVVRVQTVEKALSL
eukprot:CAMPEP_0179202438 /NCGR_PEP_ID=MMETSP0796-20121207/100835_1 /TAXON_ID=73915 /ORGANISM="Pyrodinium bahamense, Strain pbaha01" /LENGTH=198 /DNA_ID=CAMNT_0020907159 /DNA_START=28 /DNA_END=624 /DNA_ORIENTATION=-